MDSTLEQGLTPELVLFQGRGVAGGGSRNSKRLAELEDVGPKERFCGGMFSIALACLSLCFLSS